jgi:hypothetical protein
VLESGSSDGICAALREKRATMDATDVANADWIGEH